jgi:cytochrome c
MSRTTDLTGHFPARAAVLERCHAAFAHGTAAAGDSGRIKTMRLFTISAGKTAIVVALAASLAACGSPADQPAADASSAAPAMAAAPASDVAPASAAPASAAATPAMAAAGAKPATFAQCAACHSVEPGKNGVGPSLAGVFGKKAGQAAGYAYSDANKNSGLTWDEATLDEYLTAPMKKVPGTKMTFAGLADPAKRAEVIAYLKTL